MFFFCTVRKIFIFAFLCLAAFFLNIPQFFDAQYVFANDTASQVNRAKKSARLPKSQWGPPKSRRDIKKDLPKVKSTAVYINRIAEVKERQRSAERELREQTTELVKDAPMKKSLGQFYTALEALLNGTRKRPVTILHLGNDRIARDRFSGDLRTMLQARFGDAGRGMIMPGSVFPFYRARGVRLTHKGKWNVRHALSGQNDKKSRGLFGLTGSSYTSSDRNAVVRLTPKDGVFDWVELSFLAGPQQGRALVRFDVNGQVQQQVINTYAQTSQMKRVRFPASIRSISVQPEGGRSVTLLSWRAGLNQPGIRYVNLGMPKATVDFLQNLDAGLVQNDFSALQPDLVVLTFGSNEAFINNLNIAEFETRMMQLIKVLSQFAPQASFLVTGPADVSHMPRVVRQISAARPCRALSNQERVDYRTLVARSDQRLARWYPPYNLTYVRKALRRAAAQVGAYYWDWSKVMGGPCGIHAWVHSSPKLAADDHKSLTDEGAKRSAESLYSEIMSGFEAYRLVASR